MDSVWKKIIIAASVYLIVFVAIIVFALNPAIASLKQDRQKVANNQNKLDAAYDKLNSLQKTSKHPDELKSIEKVVNDSWPDDPDISQFIVQTEDLAKTNNLILDNFSIDQAPKQKAPTSSDASKDDTGQAPKKDTAPTGTQFTFSLQAPYSSVLNFIKGMETLPRFNSLSGVTFSGDESGNISARLTGSIYNGK